MIDDDRPAITARQAYDGDYWKQRAERARRMARSYDQQHIRDHFIKIAVGYDQLAERAYKIQSEIEKELAE